jgi:hypothetical protein
MLHDRSKRAVRLLEAAAMIAEARIGALTVVCEPGLAGSQGFEAWLAERLAAYALRLDIEIAAGGGEEMHQHIRHLDCGLVAVEAGNAEDRADRLRARFEHLGCDVLIVR